MAEYIERGVAIDVVTHLYGNTPDINLSESKFESVLRRIPAADVAPVVRCENCRYATWEAWASKYACGQVHGLLVFGDHFCAFGRQKGGETNG